MDQQQIRTYKPSLKVSFTTLENEESVLLNLETKRYYTLNETGTKIWQMIADEDSIADISVALSEEYEIEKEVARSYVIEFLEDLHQDGLVERVVKDPA